ncbi:filament-like plant protein 3 [Lactuca sativa]|uniref:Filament-like plant protein n=1 Tax=Lactuca sativa TaxID=4236 RepID=A0A9R1XSE4_LACSA|nr:filament-like plant protein 3 [Lactuca sativa]KAJ0225730.1 hypothetical protein LSAT_V11C100032120 [Lactuca sativa]
MDRRSWLWRKKSSERSPGETESSVGSISSHSERFSDDQIYLNQNLQSLEIGSKSDPRQSEHNNDVKTLSEKLEEALANINAKEELVKQHVKVAEEAVSGWEKAESEASSLRQQVEILNVRNSTLEDRILQLDGALKECLRQLRQTREEKDQIAHEALEKKNSETESSSTSIDIDLLHKLEMSEKENSDLKLELSSMAEELEIRLIEMELSNQAAEQASRQLLDSVKKVAKLEAECRKLKFSLEKGNDHQTKDRKNSSINERNQMESFVEIDLMDDFLEMERLVGLPESNEVGERLKKEREDELNASRKRLEEAESNLSELENELKTSRERLEEAESKSVRLENELNASRNRLEESESKLGKLENELKPSRKRLKEAESKLAEYENELKASRQRFEEAESKLHDRENELKVSRNRLKETEFKLDECEKELRASIYRLKEAETELEDRENELKPSRKRLERAESKLAELENELKTSRYRLEESETKLVVNENELKKGEFKLAEVENELNASRKRIEEAESKLAKHQNELKLSRYQLDEAESKLAETESRLEMAESRLEAIYIKKEEAESRCKALESELESLLINHEKERDLWGKSEAKCRQLENKVTRLQHELHGRKSVNRPEELRFRRAKQDKELAMAGNKFAECQKTIASLTRQLKTLATIDDFLVN